MYIFLYMYADIISSEKNFSVSSYKLKQAKQDYSGCLSFVKQIQICYKIFYKIYCIKIYHLFTF